MSVHTLGAQPLMCPWRFESYLTKLTKQEKKNPQAEKFFDVSIGYFLYQINKHNVFFVINNNMEKENAFLYVFHLKLRPQEKEKRNATFCAQEISEF